MSADSAYFSPTLLNLPLISVYIYVCSGDYLDVSDPVGSFGVEQLEQSVHVVLCAAGTGFAPMTGLMHHALLGQPNPAQ